MTSQHGALLSDDIKALKTANLHCRIMGNNEKMTVIIKFPRFFARFPIVLEKSHCLMFCQLNFH